jgi:hypothetical protein
MTNRIQLTDKNRAQGFTAQRGSALLRVDASAGLDLLILADHGDTAEAHAVIDEWLR